MQRSRSHKQSLLAEGVHGWELMEQMMTLSLERRESSPRSRHRCQCCWFDADSCICQQINELLSRENHILSLTSSVSSLLLDEQHPAVNVKLLILMHPKEYMCAGNSAKLLRMLLPEKHQQQQYQHHITVQYYIFGKLGDVDKLAREMTIDVSNTMILWPDKNALTVSQFLNQRPHRSQRHSTGLFSEEDGNSCLKRNLYNLTTPLIRAVLLDGTYTQARNMHKSLRKHLYPTPLPVMVQLHPMNGSVFHRAQKNYGHAHQHQQLLKLQKQSTTPADEGEENQGVVIAYRVSTAEACGQLLLELGVSSQILDIIVEGVIINNEALRRRFTIPRTQDG